MKHRAKQQYIAGLRAGSPVILGFVPVALAYAIMARQAGFTVAQTCGMSLLVFAGASEIMAVGMYAQGASLIAMILATFLLNLRHIIMSTCVFNRMESPHPAARLFSAFFVTDESFAIFTTGKVRTLTVGIQQMSGQYQTDYGSMGAALVIATVPTLILYMCMSGQVQKSLIAGAVKG